MTEPSWRDAPTAYIDPGPTLTSDGTGPQRGNAMSETNDEYFKVMFNKANRYDEMKAECAELGEAMRQVGIEQFEANAARLRAEEVLAERHSVYQTELARRLKAEEALRAAFEAINDDDISGAHLILRTYLAALPEKAP